VFSDDKGYYSAEPEKLQEILCFLPVIVFIFKRGCRTAGDEFVEQKEVFVGNIPLHKNLSRFLHNNHILRDSNLSLRPIFLRKLQEILCFFFTCFSLYLQERFQKHMEMNLLKPKEVFVGNIPLHKNLSRFLHNYHILRDSNLSLRPIFLRFHNK
jgi:hypothetical protein